MPTMQDVARAAGVSRTTVSIVVNGKAHQRGIPEETCNKIYNAIAQLGYRPNVSARRLKDVSTPVIALYWPMDYRMNYLARFMQGIQGRIKTAGHQCELVVRTYENDYLEQDAGSLLRGTYNGAIIAATSEADMDFLEHANILIPVALINRISDKYITVSTSNQLIAEKCVQLIWQKGYRQAAVLTSKAPYMAAGLRTRLFLEEAKRIGLETEPFVITTANSMEGGAQAVKQFIGWERRPPVIFCDSDYMAMGFAYTCNRMGIRIPSDLELIAMGVLTADFSEYATPSITVASLPVEEMAADGLDQIMKALGSNARVPVHRVHNAKILIRESFRPE